ncbi:MAG: HEAT repeat domain-containing protein [Candidatus Hodarchaeales archaeon]
MNFGTRINSNDRNIRQQTLLEIYSSKKLTLLEKKAFYLQMLNDVHDSLRSSAIDYLIESFVTDRSVQKLLISHLEIEPFWAVRFLIMRKLLDARIELTPFREMFLKLSFDIKPQVRMTAAEILSTFDDQEIWDRLLVLWKDKDERVRKKIRILLDESKNSIVKQALFDYDRKIAEKEKKRTELAGIFDGI